nr:LysR substrate-binding domain-containing protein [Marivivens niveibacter]
MCRSDHPLLRRGQSLSLDDLLDFSHVVVSSTGDPRAAFDAVLERQGRSRNIAATIMNFTMVPELLLRSDLIGVFTHRTSTYLTERYTLSIAPVPIEVAPNANHLIWHRRYSNDPAHRWLRDELRREWERSGAKRAKITF